MTTTPVRIGLLGCGTVGGALVDLVAEQHDVVVQRSGLDVVVARIAVRDLDVDRGPGVDRALLTDDAPGVATHPDVDVVVELIGGVEPARTLVLAALGAGKSVVTGNKALLAEHGAELYAAAEAAGVDLLFEAAVAGAIPLVRPLRESLVGEPIHRIIGIVNGTTNFILTKMAEEGADYDAVLAEAQALGYAEADPTADVEGHDAAAKAAIVASVAFGSRVVAEDVHCEGISGVTATDIAFAERLGYVVKLLAIVEQVPGDDGGPVRVAARVHPTLVPRDHPLASVRGSFNAVFVEGDAAGELMFYGRGAGGRPTASAVFGDVLDAGANRRRGGHGSIGSLDEARVVPIDELVAEYYLNIEVRDRPGVMAQVTKVFGDEGVSIRLMEQEGLGDDARVIFITHDARERDVQATLRGLEQLDAVRSIDSVIRVVG